MGLIAAIFGLSFLIFFHELGHFLFARLFGVKVLVFSVGFGKKILKRHYKGTQYAISIIPLGGYVKLKGEHTQDFVSKEVAHPQDSLLGKHPLKRIMIFLAGPLFNFIFAFIIYVCLFAKGVPSYSDKAIVGEIGREFGAYNVLQKNDEIISINGIKIEKFSDISSVLNKDKDSSANTARIIIERHTQNASIDTIDSISPQQDRKTIELVVPLSMKDNRIILGITPMMNIVYFSPLQIIQKSAIMVYDNVLLIYKWIRDMLRGIVGLENLSSVVGIAEVSAKAYNLGFVNFIFMLALISVNLGVINLLPIPIVDGGQILFVIYEWITGKALNERVANTLILLGLSIIISLMILGLYNDIVRIATTQ